DFAFPFALDLMAHFPKFRDAVSRTSAIPALGIVVKFGCQDTMSPGSTQPFQIKLTLRFRSFRRTEVDCGDGGNAPHSWEPSANEVTRIRSLLRIRLPRVKRRLRGRRLAPSNNRRSSREINADC